MPNTAILGINLHERWWIGYVYMVLVIKYSFLETEVDALRVKCLVFPSRCGGGANHDNCITGMAIILSTF